MIAADKVGHAAVRARREMEEREEKKKEEEEEGKKKVTRKAGQLHHVSGCSVWMCIYLISVTTRYSYQEQAVHKLRGEGYFIKVNFTSCRKA